jgi:AraC-like DNA-binding protein/quercetin dioxygenase-like cupin family protein
MYQFCINTTPMNAIDYTQPDIWNHVADVLATLDVQPSANCGRVHCEPGWRWQPRLSDYDLWFVVRGQGSMRLGDQHYAIQPGTLFVLRPGDVGHAEQDPNNRLTVAYMHLDMRATADAASALKNGAWLPSRCILFQDTAQIDALLTRAVRLMETRQRLAAVEARFVAQQALVAIYQQDARNHGVMGAQIDRRIEQVTNFIRSHPEARMSLEAAAARSGLAPTYFSRLFSQEVGMSLRAFMLQVRMERARLLLEETTMSVGEIAAALGYSDIFLLSRQFKQHYGYAPSQVRRP